MNNLRIAIIAPVLSPWIIYFKNALSRRKNDTTLYSCGIYGNHPSLKKLEEYIFKIPKREFFGDLLPSPLLVKEFLRNRYDFVIVLATESIFSMTACIAAKMAGSRTILIVEENCIRVHSSIIEKILANVKKSLVKLMHANQKIIVAESYASKFYLLGLGCKDNRIMVIPHGTDIGIFRPMPPDSNFSKTMGIGNSNHAITVAYLGGFNYLKGIDTIIKIITDPNLDGCNFIIPCFGSYNYEEYIKLLKSQSNCHILPQIDYEDILKLYSLIDIVICPSLSSLNEGCERSPNVIIEAMACGKVVIASNVGGIPTYVEEAGILVAERDIDAMKRTISRFSSDKARMEDFRGRARKRAEKAFDIEKYADTLLSFYSLIK